MESGTRKGQLSRERIVEISLQQFMQHGYDGTSLQDLCRAVGVSKGALYHHFAGKDELYYQCLQAFFSRPRAPDWRSVPGLSLRDRLWRGFQHIDVAKRFIQERVGRRDDDAILQFYGFLYEATRRYPEFQQEIDRYDDQKLHRLAQAFAAAQAEGQIRGDIDPQLLAIELEALLQQMTYLRFVNHRVKQDEQLPEQLFESYWARLGG